MFALDTKVTYQHAFVYIRQLAIHLRNAMTIKKKDSYQSVYNWQYVHCIHLWCRVLGTLHQDDNLRPLIYPLVQTSVGVIKLIPAGKYYPIRFHVIRSLNTLSAATGVFIPLLPFLTEIFDITDFNKKHASMSFKPINFAVILRLSKAQIMEKGFREGVIDQIYDLILEVCNTHCHTIGFPELVLPAIVKMKEFVKTCKVANFTRQIKQLLDKIQENCNDIEKRRSTATFGIADNGAVKAWETKYLLEGPPISKYCKTYRNLREKELRMAEAARDVSVEEIGSMTMTTKKRKAFEFIQRDHSKKELKELFHGDSDSEDDLLVRAERRQEKLDSGKKVFALVRADMDDDDEDGFSDESDEGGDDEENEEELMDAEKFKEQKTEIFREMANVKDIVEDFDMSEEEKTEVIKQKKTTTNKEKNVVPEGKMKRKVPEGKMRKNAPEGKKRRNAPEGKMRKNAPQGKMRKSKGGVKPRKKQKLVK
ncbi:putative nucleolar complex protein 2-like [Apostichopus japonicus]|uniref:Putative nucleolar complex protein 2-like n=1 Tax=Stichopus japonicus TaxID=307972 RepID=A0A2G8KDJ4_STIJA|nr:putative nucleolar complex protein 2-like [Apostichopus japonicus]